MSGRDELLALGRRTWGGEPVLFTEGLRSLAGVAAWRLPGTPTEWMVLTLGNTALEDALYRYELSGRGYEFVCRVAAEQVPLPLLERLDRMSGVASFDDVLDDPAKPVAPDGVRRVLSTALAPLETANGRVNFVQVLAPLTGDAFDEQTSSPGFRLPSPLVAALLAVGRDRSRPAVAMNFEGEADGLVFTGTRSHAGGHALVPAEFDWPTVAGRRLPLLLELQLDEVGAGEPLPSSGRLLLFGLPEDEGDAPSKWYQLRWVDGAGAPQAGDPLLPARAMCLTRFRDPSPSSLLADHPSLRSLSKRQRDRALSDYDDLSSRRVGHGYHQLLGYHHPIQDDGVVQLLVEQRGLAYPVPEEVWSELQREASEDWLTLLELESSGSPGWNFCGGGKLFVVCRLADVALRRFERAEVFVQR